MRGRINLLLAALVLVFSLGLSAMGQKNPKSSAAFLPPEPINPVVSINAIEVFDGIVGIDSKNKLETVFGYSFLGRTTGSLPGSFTLSMNCSPAIGIPGEVSEMTGGSWTLPVYLNTFKGSAVYAGAMHGSLAKGEMLWDKLGGAQVYFVLNVDGGTQTWAGVKGYATFTGSLFVDEKTQEKALKGDLVFNTLKY